MAIKIEENWKKALDSEFNKEYFKDLTEFIKKEYQSNTVYPHPKQIFSAFDTTPFNEVKIVIIGQDPYHSEGQATGLAFSVNPGVAVPPSLLNIYKEIEADTGVKPTSTGDLRSWAKQGVMLLNATLTVRAGNAGSHQKIGWEQFTDEVIRVLSENKEHLVFMLWGSYAQQKGEVIDRTKHLVLESPHPSPLSADRGFFGCRHFTIANTYLIMHDKAPINWM